MHGGAVVWVGAALLRAAVRSRGGGRRLGERDRGAVIEPCDGRSRPSPRPGLPCAKGPGGTCLPIGGLGVDSGSSMRGKGPASERDASIDPRASSTSGNDMREDPEADVCIVSSDAEEGIECWDSREGREEYDWNGGEGGNGAVGGSENGRSADGLKGEKSRVISRLGIELTLGIGGSAGAPDSEISSSKMVDNSASVSGNTEPWSAEARIATGL